MNKGLEALEELKNYSYFDDWDRLHLLKKERKEQFEIIEKELKALAIIKEKDVNIFALKVSESLEQYNYIIPREDELKYEEYNLLKEVLKDE